MTVKLTPSRHGVRLDAADRTWHLSSAAPYDPPLTYGGWNQSKALGARIGGLLRMREEGQLNGIENTTQVGSARPRKKQRIVIHSSPFIRCVQTSVGISAGMASVKRREPRKADTAMQLAELSLGGNPTHSSIQDYGSSSGAIADTRDEVPKRPLLRVDALLGEWRNPEYFENITPPPNSATMVMGAKAELLRRGEPIEITSGLDINRGNFPGGWTRSNTVTGKPPPAVRPVLGSLPLDLTSSKRERSNSHSSVESTASRSSRRSKMQRMKDDATTYVAPAPRYAVAPTDMIPPGYVAHARDACVDVDFQWDSMRSPQDWGDGGELGEEWSAMHKRVRRGFQKMIEWYKTHGVDSTPSEDSLAFPAFEDKSEGPDAESKPDDDEDLVLILVTHGAGCNSLIGALTAQPVLLDVGMASLTLAVSKEPFIPALSDRKNSSPNVDIDREFAQRRRSSVDMGFSYSYDMKLIASTEHLRAGIDPSKLGLPRPNTSGSDTAEHSIAMAFDQGGPVLGGRRNSALGSIRRSNTASTNASRRWASPGRSPNRPPAAEQPESGHVSERTASGGLWSSRTSTATATTPATPATLDGLSELEESPTGETFSIGPARGKAVEDETQETKDKATPLPAPVTRSASQGLWGPGARGVPKRRWTVDQH